MHRGFGAVSVHSLLERRRIKGTEGGCQMRESMIKYHNNRFPQEKVEEQKWEKV